VDIPLTLLSLLALMSAAAGAVGISSIVAPELSARAASPRLGRIVKWGFLGLAFILTFAAGAVAAQNTGSVLNLNVPNSQFPTIQAAIDAAPAGANIHIKPGTYHENLFVRKPLQIYGSEAGNGVTLTGPLVKAINPAVGAVGILNYEDAGGGWLQHVRFEGGPAGIVGLGGDAGAVLEINDVEVIGSGVGILWDSAATLTVRHTSILDTTTDELVPLKGHPVFEEYGLLFEGGIGIYIANADAHLSDVDVGTVKIPNHSSIGVYVRASTVKIDGGLVYGTNVAGIWAVDSTLSVDSTSLWASHTDAVSERFGDGIAILLGHAELTDIMSSNNERAGISNFGAFVKLSNAVFHDNGFSIAAQGLDASDLSPGLPASHSDYDFEDGGGNVCVEDGVEMSCTISGTDIAPPEPILP
jgi:hypothetical protein